MAIYTATLRSLVMGNGTNYPIVAYDLASPEIITNDVERLLADGKYQGPHRLSSLVVTLTLEVAASSATNLFANLETLRAAWAIAPGSNITLTVDLPSTGARSLSGRPIEFSPPAIAPIHVKWLRIPNITARFEAGNPTWT